MDFPDEVGRPNPQTSLSQHVKVQVSCGHGSLANLSAFLFIHRAGRATSFRAAMAGHRFQTGPLLVHTGRTSLSHGDESGDLNTVTNLNHDSSYCTGNVLLFTVRHHEIGTGSQKRYPIFVGLF